MAEKDSVVWPLFLLAERNIMALATTDLTFESGRSGVYFTMADDTTFPLIAPVGISVTGTGVCAYLDYVYLSCVSSASPTLVDGSSGNKILKMACASVSGGSQVWDFRDDAMKTLGKDSTEALCISVSSAADVAGFIKWHAGV